MKYTGTIIGYLLFIYFGRLVAVDIYHEQKINNPVFISLGCSCEVAHQLRWNGMRDRAFPFDWLLTTNCAGFVALLEDNFKFFMDNRYLSMACHNSTYTSLFNNYYYIEFRHDLYDMDTSFEEHLPFIQEKYEKRIHRFRELGSYPGKVYFIRSAYPPEYDHSSAIVTEECLALTFSHAKDLRDTLNKLFPYLDFTLVIVNYRDVPCPEIIGLEKVIEFKIGKDAGFADLIKSLK